MLDSIGFVCFDSQVAFSFIFLFPLLDCLPLRAASESFSILSACLYLLMPSVFACKCGQIAYDFSNDVISILYDGATGN